MSYLSDILGDAYKDGMSVEEISKALESAKVGVPTKESNTDDVAKLKDLLSQRNSEVASYKKQLREKQTAEEAAEAERSELLKSLSEENSALKKAMTISKNQSSLMSLGYSEELAVKTATAMFDGKTDDVLANMKAFLEEHDKAVIKAQMADTPRPSAGGSNDSVMTLEKFRKLSPTDRQEFAMNHQDEYLAMYKIKED